MRSRPLPLIFLATLHIAVPVFNTAFSALLMKESYGTYLQTLVRESSFWALFCAFALYPIAGAAILAIKEWSYGLYTLSMGIGFYHTVNSYQLMGQTTAIAIFVAANLISLALVTYFLLPLIRRSYFDRHIHWWQAKPRYQIELPAIMKGSFGECRCMIRDLSEGGVFIKFAKRLDPAEIPEISFSIFDQLVRVDCSIIYRRAKGITGYGMQFRHTPQTKHQIKRIIRGIRLMGVQTAFGRTDWTDGFKNWATTLIKPKKGFLQEALAPEYNLRAVPKPETKTEPESKHQLDTETEHSAAA